MRVLHVAAVRSDRSSGVSVYVVNLLKALSRQGGLSLGLLPTVDGHDPHAHASIPGVTLLPGPERPQWDPWRLSSDWMARIEAGFGRPDAVHFHGVYDPFQSALARRLREARVPYLAAPHGGFHVAAQGTRGWKKALGNALFFDAFVRGAAAVHALNPDEASAVQKRYPGVRTLLVPNGIPSDILKERDGSAPAPGTRPGTLTVGYIGRLEVRHKGLDLLFAAIAALQRAPSAPDLRFSLTGPFQTAADEAELRALHAALPEPGRVVFTGPLTGKDKWRALSGFDLFIHSSRYEGMPGAVLEAMAFARPCVLTPGTNLQQALLEHGAGWACGEEPASIAAALAEAAAERGELAARGERGRAFVLARYTWDAIAAGYVRDLSDLLSA